MKELVCIVCPKGCRLSVDEENGYAVTGNSCPRGEEYGKNELRDPHRAVTSTVHISGAMHPRLPVKTDGEIKKADGGKKEHNFAKHGKNRNPNRKSGEKSGEIK